ncbi:MAG TPA: hypothetical protein VGY66_14275 [Gemmataceae bacterium]|nr:hypothetical protein [Gemmataceae bacterium]
MRLLFIMLVCASIVVAQDSRGDVSRLTATEAGPNRPPEAAFPIGKWKVEFSNGVTEVCHIGNGGECTVEEPGRRSNGMAEVKGGALVITFNDNRIERWSPVGRRYVVEHWFPASQVPVVSPVLGIAEAAQ